MRRIALASTSWLLVILLRAPAFGAETTHFDLEHTSGQALGTETVVALSLLGGTMLFMGPQDNCRWCESNSFDESVRSTLRANNPRPYGFASHILSMGAIPGLGLTVLAIPAFEDQKRYRLLEDAWLIFNVFALTTAIGELTKNTVARERPAFHHGVENETEFSSWPSERNKSLFSLDTAWAFSFASSAATLAHLRGYASRDYLAVVGGVLAFGTGMLRIVTDAHWTTDVLVGAAVGTSVGIAMPTLLHGRRKSETTLAIVPTSHRITVQLARAF